MNTNVEVMKPILAQKVSNLLVAAIGSWNGGSRYWCHEAKLLRSDVKPTKSPWYADPAVFKRSFEFEFEFDEKYEGDGAGRKRITRGDVRRGLAVMRRDYPKRYADMMGDRGDADTADVFVQCAMFGKAIYGCEAPSPYTPAMLEQVKRLIAEIEKRDGA